ncbi:MAG: hypothetical protein ACXWWC_07900 [Chitinophagaceae bacterium]
MKILQFIADKKGKKLSVVLPLKDYKKIMEELKKLFAYLKKLWLT